MSEDLTEGTQVATSTIGAWLVVAVAGELDALVTPRLEGALHEAIDSGVDQLAVDLDAVEFLDSTALRALVGTLNRAQARNVRFVVVCGAERVRKLLRITRLDEVFEVAASRDELR